MHHRPSNSPARKEREGEGSVKARDFNELEIVDCLRGFGGEVFSCATWKQLETSKPFGDGEVLEGLMRWC
jgi:hypothetical protein